jgi:hypothetical protein
MVFFKHPFQLLKNPGGGIPFHRQAFPIPDPLQKHFTVEEHNVVTSAYNTSNTLPLNRFLGTDWSQQNQTKFLGANERIAFEGSW